MASPTLQEVFGGALVGGHGQRDRLLTVWANASVMGPLLLVFAWAGVDLALVWRVYRTSMTAAKFF